MQELMAVLAENDSMVNSEHVSVDMQISLNSLKQQLCYYFPKEFQNSYDGWILNPFLDNSF